MHHLGHESCKGTGEHACISSRRSVGGAVGPELPDDPAARRNKLMMQNALHSDMTDSTVSQTAACSQIIIYTADIGGNTD